MSKYKVIPTIFHKKTKPCCICFENKQHFISCSNTACTDGIICFNCLKNMSPQQKNICQICRVPTNNFKKTHQILSLPKKKSTKKCFHLLENIKILILSILIPIFAYFLGLIVMYLFFDINIKYNMRSLNPFIFVIIGILSLCLCISCWCCWHHLINIIKNNRRNIIVYPSINTY